MKRTVLLGLFSCLVFFSFAQDKSFYFITSDSVRLFVRVTGSGRPCVFVHGGPGSTSHYLEAMPSAALLEKELQMIYYDQRGCGRSGSPRNGDYRLARMLRDLEELRTHLKLKSWAVMGHSFGGVLVANYAHRHPASVSSLLLIHATLDMQYSMTSHLEFGLKELGIRDQRVYRDSSRPLIERVSLVHDSLTKKGVWYKLMYRNAYEKKFNDTVSNVLGPLNRDFAAAAWGVSDYWSDFTTLTPKITCPVLVMTGEKDFAIGPDHYRQFRFPRATIVRYIGGHAPFQEEPQWFAEKVLGFMKR